MPAKPLKGNILLILLFVFLIIASLAIFVYYKTVLVYTRKVASNSRAVTVVLTKSYSNPLDKDSQYVNPFAYQNPLDELK